MLKERNSQGNVMFIIIFAVLGLIVLFVLSQIFTKETGDTVRALESCGTRGGDCKTNCDNDEIELTNIVCPPKTSGITGRIEQIPGGTDETPSGIDTQRKLVCCVRV